MHARDAGRAPPPLLDTEAWFGRSAPVVLEIGCGTGTSTLAMAQAEPHIDVVAVEVYRRGLAQLLSAIDARRRHQHPPGPRRRRRRARAHVRPGFADRGAGVLPRPVAQGAPPQAPAAAAGHRRPDRRPAAARRCAARRHRPRRLRRADRRGAATPNRGCAASPLGRRPAHLGGSGRSPSTRRRRATRAARSPNCSGRSSHEHH